MNRSNYIVYDCETGGLDETKNPITQYACVVLDYSTLKEIDRFETFVRPYNNLIIEKDALLHTMVTMSDVRSGISVENFVDVLFEFNKLHQAKSRTKDMARLVPVGHNIVFDNRFLNYACDFCGKKYHELVYENYIDTFPLSKMMWGIKGDEKLNLTACSERAKIKLTDAHGAMNDVESTADLFRFFVKKLRSKGGISSADINTRPRGKDFFEFKCGAK
jgi:DNA polymerase III alpha subunit (gram-positive type)